MTVSFESYEQQDLDHQIYDRHSLVKGWNQTKLSGGSSGGAAFPGSNMVVVGSGRLADLATLFSICIGSKKVCRVIPKLSTEHSFYQSGDGFSNLVQEVTKYRLLQQEEFGLEKAVEKAMEGNHDPYLLLAGCAPSVCERAVQASQERKPMTIYAHASSMKACVVVQPKGFPLRNTRINDLSIGAQGVAASLLVDAAVYDAVYEKNMRSVWYYNGTGTRLTLEPDGFKAPRMHAPKGNVTLVGAGGIGHWAALMMAMAGIPLTVIDGDSIEVVNFVKQPFFGMGNGRPKVEVLKEMFARHVGVDIQARPEYLYGENGVEVERLKCQLVESNIERLLESADLIVSAVDTAVARRDMELYAIEHGVPMIDGGLNVEQITTDRCRCTNQPYGSHVLTNALIASIMVDNTIKYLSGGGNPPARCKIMNVDYVEDIGERLPTPMIDVEERSFIPQRGDVGVTEQFQLRVDEVITNLKGVSNEA